MPISDDIRESIRSLLAAGELPTEEIAEKLGVSPRTVSAIKAHITMGRYGLAPPAAEMEEELDAFETTFGLERDLQAALRANIGELEAELVIIDDGKERSTAAGRIDILARDKAGATVVVELKAGDAKAEVVTQTLGYMGALAAEGVPLQRGIIVAGRFPDRVIHAARAVPNLRLVSDRFKFSFSAGESTGKL
jgi:hypothetical protein